ncbi:cathepsin O-like isoform X2 [Topomyia yanbarensis]|uniref:cathepsin O-like isoform X2 n=1 Tax=Topomyia yanbarensis TaxID=2498891 RepID=UPI00273B5996|nr:cathepsin O-like isoform X2 [Topomyia yanbarensis]
MSEVIEMILILIIVTLCFLMIPFNLQPNAVIEARRKFEIFIRLYDKPYRYNVPDLKQVMVSGQIAQERGSPLDKFVIESKSAEMKDAIIFSRAKRSLFIPDYLPKVVDWREKNVVPTVKSQGNCGACWAISVVDTISSLSAIKQKQSNVTDLCIEKVINCAGNGNFGCDGGDTCRLLEWLQDERIELSTLSDCLSIQSHKNGSDCEFQKAGNREFISVERFSCVSLVDREHLMLRYLATRGPIVAAVNAISWQYYLGGVVQYHCESRYDDLNHAVEIVGYNLENSIPYYWVKNSWGTAFGDHGYIKIEIGKNLCGIANRVSFIELV